MKFFQKVRILINPYANEFAPSTNTLISILNQELVKKHPRISEHNPSNETWRICNLLRLKKLSENNTDKMFSDIIKQYNM